MKENQETDSASKSQRTIYWTPTNIEKNEKVIPIRKRSIQPSISYISNNENTLTQSSIDSQSKCILANSELIVTQNNVFNTIPPTTNIMSEFNRSSFHYRINRDRSYGFGKRLIFRFFNQSEQIYIAKCKGFSIDKCVIKQGSEVHLSQPPFDAILRISGMAERVFLLYRYDDSSKKNQIMKCRIIPGGYNNPRTFILKFIDSIPAHYPPTLVSREPRYDEEKKRWQLDYNGKFVCQSVRNCILEGSKLHRAIIIRKTTPEDLELDVITEIDPLYVFGIALASFLS